MEVTKDGRGREERNEGGGGNAKRERKGGEGRGGRRRHLPMKTFLARGGRRSFESGCKTIIFVL
jgi:hypothetical protein